MNRTSVSTHVGFGIATGLLFSVLATVEIWNQTPVFLGPLKQQVVAALRDPVTQWLVLAALAGYFIMFCILEHRLSASGKWWRLGNADLWLSALVVLAVLRFPYSNQRGIGFTSVSTFLAGVVFGKAVSTLACWQGARVARNTAWLGGLLLCLLAGAALWQPATGGMRIQYHEVTRWTGIWRNPNHYGLMMGAGLVLATGAGLMAWQALNGNRRKKLGLIACSIAAALCGCGLFRSYSRGAWLGVLAGLVYLAVQTGKNSRPLVWLRLNRLPLALLIVSLTLLTFWQFRFSEWPPARRVFSVANINDFSWRNRVAAWEWALRSMMERPLAGIGWVRVPSTNGPNYSPPQATGSAISTNDFLVLGTSAGVPALLCFAVCLALSFRAKPAVLHAPASMFTTCRAGSIVFLVGFWLDGGLFILAVAMVFWLLLELSRRERAEAGAASSEAQNEPAIARAAGRAKWEVWLWRTSLALAAIALLQSAMYVGTPFFPVSDSTLAIARKCLIPPIEKTDLDYLAPNPIWTGRELRVLLEHVELANYNRRLVNWTLDDSMYREYVLSPAIQPESDGLLRWRRPLWEFFYPGIRKQNHDLEAAKFVRQQLRRAVEDSADAPSTIEEMWREKSADARGFEALSVAAFRSVGVPARLDGDGKAEFFDGKIWQPASSLPK